MEVQENLSLKDYNTFKVESSARFFVEISSVEELKAIVSDRNKYGEVLVLGGGSNILFTKDFNGLVILIDIKGREIVREEDGFVDVKVNAGEVWDDFVKYSVENNLSGIENTSFVPGKVGAAPMGNIGCYGQEVKETILEVEALNTETLEIDNFKNPSCKFGYRSSVFKENIGKYIVTSVTFRLKKDPEKLNIEYKDLKIWFAGKKPTIQGIRDALFKIRGRKLPDLEKYGSVGSFFKNVYLSDKDFKTAIEKYPDLRDVPVFDEPDGTKKIPSAWLVDKTGLKGYTKGKVAVHQNQPLVLVNLGGANGQEIFSFSKEIIAKVKEKFGVELEPEVQVY